MVGQSQKNQTSYIKDPNTWQRERVVDFGHMNLSVEFQPDSGKVLGTVTHTFISLQNNLDSIYLDGVDMQVLSATFNQDTIEVSNLKKGLGLKLPTAINRGEEHKITIQYTAKPRKGLYFIGWDDPTGRCRKQIWTQGQGIDNRSWIPMFDDMADKIKTDILISMDTSFEVLSNGSLINRFQSGESNYTWHYHMDKPHSPYLIMLGIGRYKVQTVRSSTGIPLNMYNYPEWPQRREPTYRFTKEIFDYLEEEIGVDYPWGSYSQVPVQDFPYGAMENTSATIFGDFFCTDSIGFNDVNYVYVNGHELAHQWYGDLITSRSPNHHWLHESFATYYHHLVVKQFLGDDDFQKMMRDNQKAALAASTRDLKGVGHSQAGTPRHYLKGSYVLKMLRYVVGDEDFRTGMQYYLNRNQYGTVSTQDLIDAFAESTGWSIGWFIDQWVYHGGEPHFKVTFEQGKKGGEHQLFVEQIQDTNSLLPTFRMPVNIGIKYKGENISLSTHWIESGRDTFSIQVSSKSKIEYVLFDPNSEILKWIEFDKPTDWLVNQATSATNMIDKYDGVVALRSIKFKKKEQALHQLLKGDDYYLIRGEALIQLVENDAVTTEEIELVINGNDIQLKKVLVQSMKEISEEQRTSFEKLLSDQSYGLIQMALVRLCSSFPEKAPEYLERTKTIYGVRGNNVRIQWLELSYLINEEKKSADELVDMCSNSYDFITRQSAMATLKRIDYCTPDLVFNLAQGIQKANWKLASTSGKLLKHFSKSEKYAVMVREAADQLDLSEKARKSVERFVVRP